MKEIARLSQSRRDFMALYQCENCGNEEKISGYDDSNFHLNVVPNVKCKKCGESSISLNADIIDKTIVPANVVI